MVHSPWSQAEQAAMARAINLAAQAERVSPNPRVGCVVLDAEDSTVGSGFHHGPGQPHAEIEALREAGSRARGGTAVVTLEPCRHTGRTGPCTQALLAAGIRRVVFARHDPSSQAGGGGAELACQGLDVRFGLLEDQADLNPWWESAVHQGRPYVIWKAAASLDGAVAAADGTSQWITGEVARAASHRLRSQVDAIAVGAGTLAADDPSLTARVDGLPLPPAQQPLRVLLSQRELGTQSRVTDDAAPTVRLPMHDPREVLATLWRREVRSLLLEGGPTVAGAWLEAGVVNEINWYLAPMLLGDRGRSAARLDVATLAQASRWKLLHTEHLGDDVFLRLVPRVPAQKDSVTTRP